MIRRGKQEGWLQADHSTLQEWASFYGVESDGVEIRPVQGKGLAVFAKSPSSHVLMRVPRDLVLSRDAVELQAKSDVNLRTVLNALGDFGRTSRGSILVFLLYQSTKCCPTSVSSSGSSSPLTEYIKFLPMELLPTFWTKQEVELLTGTSLQPAIIAKLKSLNREFELLRSSTENLSWCAENWWDTAEGSITFDDWKLVDAFYRSRALEFPGIGDCMVPCIDMCNHESAPSTRALYESDDQGNAILLAQEPDGLESSDEITITYGDEKGACEMIFSYGFLESSMDSAKTIFLSLEIPDSDPLKPAKLAIAKSAPGVRLVEEQSGDLQWFSDHVWLICVNEEDGLKIELAQTLDGASEIQATWQDSDLLALSSIEETLRKSPIWKVYELRAIVTLQNRVEDQLRAIYGDETPFQQRYSGASLRQQPKYLAQRLRELEAELLDKFYELFENMKLRLAESAEVQHYLAQATGAGQGNTVEYSDDFC